MLSDGVIVLAPPASGKSFYIENDCSEWTDKWVDQDDLFKQLGFEWSIRSGPETYQPMDCMLHDCKRAGMFVMGSLFWEYVPDAVVIPPLNIHLERIRMRPDLDVGDAIEVRTLLQRVSKMHALPSFESFAQADAHIH